MMVTVTKEDVVLLLLTSTERLLEPGTRLVNGLFSQTTCWLKSDWRTMVAPLTLTVAEETLLFPASSPFWSARVKGALGGGDVEAAQSNSGTAEEGLGAEESQREGVGGKSKGREKKG